MKRAMANRLMPAPALRGEDDEQGKGSDAESDEWATGEDSDTAVEEEESDDEDDICKDCGKALNGEIWKRLPIHKNCGRMRGRLTTALEDNPQLLQVLVDARKMIRQLTESCSKKLTSTRKVSI